MIRLSLAFLKDKAMLSPALREMIDEWLDFETI